MDQVVPLPPTLPIGQLFVAHFSAKNVLKYEKKLTGRNYFLCKRKWSCLACVFFPSASVEHALVRPTNKFHERTLLERRLGIKDNKTINSMHVACFKKKQKIKVVCQVLIKITLICFDRLMASLGHARTLRIRFVDPKPR